MILAHHEQGLRLRLGFQAARLVAQLVVPTMTMVPMAIAAMRRPKRVGQRKSSMRLLWLETVKRVTAISKTRKSSRTTSITRRSLWTPFLVVIEGG